MLALTARVPRRASVREPGLRAQSEIRVAGALTLPRSCDRRRSGRTRKSMAKQKRTAGRRQTRRNQPPGVVLIVMIASFSIGTLLICGQVARLVYATGITGDIRSRLQADYRPWTPEAFAPVSTGIALGTPEPVKSTQSILDATATPTCAPSLEDCASSQDPSAGAAGPAGSTPTPGADSQGAPPSTP